MCNLVIEFENATYSQLKDWLKNEYLVSFKEYVDLSIRQKDKLIIERFGEDFLVGRELYFKTKEQIDTAFDEFYQSQSYKDAQNTVATLNEKLLTCSNAEKELVEEDIKKALSKIETLNVTIKNRTQKLREELEILKVVVEKTQEENKDFFDDVDKKIESLVIEKLSEIVNDYNQVLKGLSSIYDVEPQREKEYPFTEDELLSNDLPKDLKKGVIDFVKRKLQN
ncbi:MAG: hypothetical protein IJC87_05475 [Clostridia bacterium]|nr:hypothetical protein [Clostridia bacterium]